MPCSSGRPRTSPSAKPVSAPASALKRPSGANRTAAPPSNSCKAPRRDGWPNQEPSDLLLLSGMVRSSQRENRGYGSGRPCQRVQPACPPKKNPAFNGCEGGDKVHWVEIHAPGKGERGEVASTILFGRVARTTGLKRTQARDFFPTSPAKIPLQPVQLPVTAPRPA